MTLCVCRGSINALAYTWRSENTFCEVSFSFLSLPGIELSSPGTWHTQQVPLPTGPSYLLSVPLLYPWVPLKVSVYWLFSTECLQISKGFTVELTISLLWIICSGFQYKNNPVKPAFVWGEDCGLGAWPTVTSRGLWLKQSSLALLDLETQGWHVYMLWLPLY